MTDRTTSSKSADAYRTISEVAEDLKLPQHVLRFWETRFPQVKPLKRAGGRRFYRPEDVDLLRAVKTLLYGDGYTIKGVQRMLRERGPRGLVAVAADVKPRPLRSAGGQRHADVADDSGSPEIGSVGRDEGPKDERNIDADRTPEWLLAIPERGAEGAANSSLVAAPAGPRRTVPRPDVVERLNAVLLDLVECERLLSAARSGQRR